MIMEERKNRIVAFMKEEAYKPLLFEELAMVLAVPSSDMELFRQVMDELEQEGRVFRTNKKRYAIPERMNLVPGRFQGSEKGFGFVIPDDEHMEDVFIPAEGVNGAMHGDMVMARIAVKAIPGRSAEGEIIKVIKRENERIVGTFESSRNFGFVIPDDKRISMDIFIPKEEINGAVTGQKVVAEITKWPEKRRNAEGRIVEIIGYVGQPGIDIISIIKAHRLREEFPEEVLIQARSIPDTVTSEMMAGRRDLRSLRMVTIDGEDAKDLDDAVSIQKLDDDTYRLGVHIADVSHYVKEGTPLDMEALKRGTSVYLVDRVLPMLPKELSNGICSLNPHVDRLAFSVMMDVDRKGRVINHEIFESVINIDERMTYTDVYKILEEDDEGLKARYKHLLEDFYMMKELAEILRNRRMERGALDFDFGETKVTLDENGRPIDVRKYEITIANRIIEEFMLLCNETVAEYFYWADVPFVYRIHEEPMVEKMQSLAEFVYNLGYTLKGVNNIHPRALQELLKKIKGAKEETLISTVMLRSLQKARYSPYNDGHFGLAAKFYCHFTSPIRRYPDLIIHRIMKEYLKGTLTENRIEHFKSILPEITNQCSERERAAEEAERETVELKKVEYMTQHVGESFEGIVSNVTSFGMFVELENTVEGLVRMSDLDDDFYVYNEKQYALVGERTRKVYKIGDVVRVKAARADVAARQIDFVLDMEDEESEITAKGKKNNKKRARIRR